jgi:pentatricopeptide repeat protein
LQESLQAALRAIYLDEKNPYAHYALAMACIFTSAEQAILPAEKVVELSPGFALGHFAVGLARLSSGRASDALGPFQRGLKLSPHDPQNLAWFNLLATAQLIAGDAEGALSTAARALAVRPDWRPTLETMACCYAATGKWEDARRCVQEMARLKGPSSFSLAALRERIPQWRDQMSDLLRKAGWTEQSNFVPGATCCARPAGPSNRTLFQAPVEIGDDARTCVARRCRLLPAWCEEPGLCSDV